jgi:hypothetical protein
MLNTACRTNRYKVAGGTGAKVDFWKEEQPKGGVGTDYTNAYKEGGTGAKQDYWKGQEAAEADRKQAEEAAAEDAATERAAE